MRQIFSLGQFFMLGYAFGVWHSDKLSASAFFISAFLGVVALLIPKDNKPNFTSPQQINERLKINKKTT